MQKTYLGTIYSNQYGEFQRGIYPIARCLKAEQHDLSVVELIKFEKGVDKLNDTITMVRQDKTRQDKTRQDKTSKTRQARQARQDKQDKQVEVIGCMDSNFESTSRVYSVDGVSPTVCTYCGGNQEAKILEVKKVDDVKEIGYLDNGTGKHQSNIVYGTDSVSPTITTIQGGGTQQLKILETKSIKIRQATKYGFIDCKIGGVVDLDYPDSQTRRERVIENGMICPTLTTENIPSVIEFGNPDFYNFLYEIDGELYLIRIRKLIPKECWRLMGFTDEDFEKAETKVSNTQLYKQAGNSICKNVLMAIFKQIIDTQ